MCANRNNVVQPVKKSGEKKKEKKRGPLTLTRLLGQGSFGQVWLMKDKTSNTSYALKSGNRSGKFAEQKLEAEIAAMKASWTDVEMSDRRIGNKNNIIEGEYVQEAMENPSLLLEYCEGGDLFEFMQEMEGDLPDELILRFILELLQGLASIHHAGYLHRDIKPENIFLTGNCEETGGEMLKIGDFGGAIKMSSVGGALSGTPMWLSTSNLLNTPGQDLMGAGLIALAMCSKNPSPLLEQMADHLRTARAKGCLQESDSLRASCIEQLEEEIPEGRREAWNAVSDLVDGMGEMKGKFHQPSRQDVLSDQQVRENIREALEINAKIQKQIQDRLAKV